MTHKELRGLAIGIARRCGVTEHENLIGAIHLRPGSVEFDIYLLNDAGEKYVDLEINEPAMWTRSFEVSA